MALSPISAISATPAVAAVGPIGPKAAAQAPAPAAPPRATTPQVAYQVPTGPTQKLTDEQTESALVKAREAQVGQDAAIPIQSKGSLVNIRV